MVRIDCKGKFTQPEIQQLRKLGQAIARLDGCQAVRFAVTRHKCDRHRCMAWLPWSLYPVVGHSVDRLCERVIDSAQRVADECSKIRWRRIIAMVKEQQEQEG